MALESECLQWDVNSTETICCVTSTHETRTVGNSAAACLQWCLVTILPVNVMTLCLTTTKHPHEIHRLSLGHCTLLCITCITITYINSIFIITTIITTITRHGAVGRASDLRSRGGGFESRPATQHKNSGQVYHTYVPLSPSSTSWYRPKGGDVLQLGSKRRYGSCVGGR